MHLQVTEVQVHKIRETKYISAKCLVFVLLVEEMHVQNIVV